MLIVCPACLGRGGAHLDGCPLDGRKPQGATMDNSLKASDDAAAKHAVAPRVALADIEHAIVARFHLTGDQLGAHSTFFRDDVEVPVVIDHLRLLSICVVVMKNGFTIVGKSAPASPENFNADFGRELAYKDCITQLWPLMGYALKDRLAAGPGDRLRAPGPNY